MFIIPKIDSLGEKLGRGLGEGLGQGSSNLIQQLVSRKNESRENQTLKRLTGKDFSGLSPDVKREFLKIYTGAHSQRAQEKQNMLEGGLNTIEKMRGLLESAGGWTSNIANKLASLNPNSETSQKRTELAQLGTSLIPLASAGVSIRNQKEFDQYKKIITDPNSSPAELEGALNGLESIISGQLHNPEVEIEETVKEKPVFDIAHPAHKKTFDALMKKYKGDREKVRRELLKHYEE